MIGCAVDQIFESLGIPPERNLAEGAHGKQPSQRIESLFFKDGMFLVEVLLQPIQ